MTRFLLVLAALVALAALALYLVWPALVSAGVLITCYRVIGRRCAEPVR